MTPGNLFLVHVYMDATEYIPFSYIFINLTQECDPRVKFLSDLFCNIHVYIPNGKTFKKIKLVGNYKNVKMIDTTLPNPTTFKHNFVEPLQVFEKQQQSEVTQPLQVFEKQQEIIIKPEIILKKEKDNVGINTNQDMSTYTQTEPKTFSDQNTNTSHPIQTSTQTSSQTEPRTFTNQSTNTQDPPQTSTQTGSRTFSNQSTNIPHPIQTSTQTE